ncbi:sugar phosphate nucleotidyltransferase [Paenibacillus qinlingensis]|uniref:sugar phosphate nucleotidyltransferase n=1 Tax=Paenibacillus qinlingensis TaxID=1837343 RepID=UPI001563E849|nr:sugar phosphate nucleotidyltransferase [Paenibacillus qinlingensis]NQX58256.1 cupin domain-containing protein [Paenibacillus qinlingensis]
MRIVLLCGGSGKRLWPLSNEIRSKVFLKLLKSTHGVRESMIERICRQLDEVGLLQSTCIVTHHSQVEITRTYVGEHIPIISEPHKRGTYAAIALAVTYLHERMLVDSDETICILPVDTYADSAFFQLLHRLPDILSRSKADLALLGTNPTMPSDQFGYIVSLLPGGKEEYARIHHFIEKPNERAALQLIEKNALWNCGVFAFRLGFMLKYLKDKVEPDQVDMWLDKYEQLANNSFDREVVEPNPNAVVVRYEGLWQDVGTWKALTPHCEQNVIGSGRISDDSMNTHLINELPYPIEVIGVPDLIVAASSDGILIAHKEKAHLIKERLAQTTQFPMQVEKRWGSYQIMNYWKDEHGAESIIKMVKIVQGNLTSYHQHENRQESLTILSGIGEVLMGDKLYRLVAGDVILIPAGIRHGIKAVTNLEFMEVLLGKELSQEDITRYSQTW